MTVCSTHITTMLRLTFCPLFNKVRVHLVQYSSQLSLLTSTYANSLSIALRGFDPRTEGRNDTSKYYLKRCKIYYVIFTHFDRIMWSGRESSSSMRPSIKYQIIIIIMD